MDIADIRKKAREQKAAEEVTPSTEEQAVAENHANGGLIIDDEPESGLIVDDESESGLIIDDEPESGLIIDDEPESVLIIDDEPVESDELPVVEPEVRPVTPSVEAHLPAQTKLDKLFSEETLQDFATEESYEQVLSTDVADQDQSGLRQYLAFNLASEEYALDITQISEIIKVRELTDIPRVPDYILGIISLRGVVVPIFDLNKRFRLGETTVTTSSRIVVCQVDELQAGLLVDSINQVITMNEENIEPPPAVLSGIDRELVSGVGRYQGRMIILLQLKSVLDIELK